MQHYTYLLINFFTIIICFVFSFHHKIKFSRFFGAFIKSAALVAFAFIIWDIWFTARGVWWFNHDYIIGLTILGLPFEEILFFFCIPFACIFTYFCLNKFFNFNWQYKKENYFAVAVIVLSLGLGIYQHAKIYTMVTFLTTGVTVFILYFMLNARIIGKASVIYMLLMPGFLLVNGILTGTGLESPIVNYNPDNFMGFRILTIPLEDVVYGYELILWNIYFFELIGRTKGSLS